MLAQHNVVIINTLYR